jgi:DNA-directed RNA polymerase specialized sigma24 family protein/CheY-like chemotaxis protein
MTLSDKLGPHLPYLRRFARALTGSQPGGDAYVAATLEALLADQSLIKDKEDARAGLYRIFLKIWTSGSPDTERTLEEADGMQAAERKLGALPARERQAFILVAVEGFSVSEAAHILDTTATDVEALIEAAGQQIAQQVATDVLIIEDEPIIAIDLEHLVRSLGHEVIGIARTQSEAQAILRNRRPGLVLADIQLADGSSGIDAVNDLLRIVEVPVIFITAYPERLLTGARPEPVYLFAKPFRADTVKAVISQALFFEAKATPADIGGDSKGHSTAPAG